MHMLLHMNWFYIWVVIVYFDCNKIFPKEYDLMLRTLVSPAARVIMLASYILEGKQMTLTEY